LERRRLEEQCGERMNVQWSARIEIAQVSRCRVR
jgi:hypothetical protein